MPASPSAERCATVNDSGRYPCSYPKGHSGGHLEVTWSVTDQPAPTLAALDRLDAALAEMTPGPDAGADPLWEPIETFSGGDHHRVDLWMNVHASPRSFGIADAFRVIDAYQQDGKWFDSKGELYSPSITHWAEIVAPTNAVDMGEVFKDANATGLALIRNMAPALSAAVRAAERCYWMMPEGQPETLQVRDALAAVAAAGEVE